jgi:hypothetical protein
MGLSTNDERQKTIMKTIYYVDGTTTSHITKNSADCLATAIGSVVTQGTVSDAEFEAMKFDCADYAEPTFHDTNSVWAR